MSKENNEDVPPKAARKLAEATGEPAGKFTPSDETEFPEPEDLERVDPDEAE